MRGWPVCRRLARPGCTQLTCCAPSGPLSCWLAASEGASCLCRSQGPARGALLKPFPDAAARGPQPIAAEIAATSCHLHHHDDDGNPLTRTAPPPTPHPGSGPRRGVEALRIPGEAGQRRTRPRRPRSQGQRPSPTNPTQARARALRGRGGRGWPLRARRRSVPLRPSLDIIGVRCSVGGDQCDH